MAARLPLQRLLPLHSPRKCHIPSISPHARRRHASDFSHLQTEMLSRQLYYVTDYLHTMPSRLLQATLADFFPPGFIPDKAIPTNLHPGYHLAYFPKPTRLSTLLPDGTDPLQSPGAPFNHRMWAGGQLYFSDDRVQLLGHPCHCNEKITDVQIKGQGADQKVFVQIARLVFPGRYPNDPEEKKKRSDGALRYCVKEERTIVFMRDDRLAVSTDVTRSPPKILKPTQTPDFSLTVVPTAALLFRFSALTFNAHAIHLDRQYCREIEGHRNILVHGPLSLMFILETLRGHLRRLNRRRTDDESETIYYIEYRNMAPLYAEEEMKICLKLRDNDDDTGRIWDVWIEGRDGGYAVKGLVKTMIKKQRLGSEIKGDAITGNFRQILRIRFPWSKNLASGQKSAAGGMSASKKEISEGDETVTDEAAFQQGLASVKEISTGDEIVPDNETAAQEEGASETERPADEDHEEENAPYYQR